MKYEVITDKQGYCVIIRHTGTSRDIVELDLSQYDLSDRRVNAYLLGKNELIFDNSKWQKMQKEEEKKSDLLLIDHLRQKLKDTDYITAKWVEELISLSNPLTWVADVIKINVKYTKEYAKALKDRDLWRKKIEELEGKVYER